MARDTRSLSTQVPRHSNAEIGKHLGLQCHVEMTQELVEAMNHGDPSAFAAAARRQMAGRTLRRDADGAARRLGLNPGTLYARMKKLGISRPYLLVTAGLMSGSRASPNSV